MSHSARFYARLLFDCQLLIDDDDDDDGDELPLLHR